MGSLTLEKIRKIIGEFSVRTEESGNPEGIRGRGGKEGKTWQPIAWNSKATN